MIKKLGREVWDLIFPYVSSAGNKRGKDQTLNTLQV